jgi:glycosyltransferase involved in cell wall biosynthesis
LRVLLVHNRYQIPGGEDSVFENEAAMLTRAGCKVVKYERHNDEIGNASVTAKLSTALSAAWSNGSYDHISTVIKQEQPDVVHFHNTFPLISPSAYAACAANGVASVQTLHNFRLACPAGTFSRNGAVCELCLHKSLVSSLRHRCYKGSFLGTATVVWMLQKNRLRGTYQNDVTKYIALTDFARSKLVSAGLPDERMEVKPNFLPEPPKTATEHGRYIIFVGRLMREKGLWPLLDAWEYLPDVRLLIVGDGPDGEALAEKSGQAGLRIEFLGNMPKPKVIELVQGAAALIVPSLWYEGFPMVIAEAYACGTAVLSSRLGSLDEVVVEGKTGLKFEPGNPQSIASTVRRFVDDPTLARQLQDGAKRAFEENYTEARNAELLLDIYERAQSSLGAQS